MLFTTNGTKIIAIYVGLQLFLEQHQIKSVGHITDRKNKSSNKMKFWRFVKRSSIIMTRTEYFMSWNILEMSKTLQIYNESKLNEIPNLSTPATGKCLKLGYADNWVVYHVCENWWAITRYTVKGYTRLRIRIGVMSSQENIFQFIHMER